MKKKSAYLIIRRIFVFLTILSGFSISQEYELGDTITSEHQNLDLSVCAGGDDILNLSNYNHNINGGDEYVIWLDIFAPT